MRDIYDIRRANLSGLVSEIRYRRPGLREQDVAAALDLGASHYSQIKAGKPIGDDVARKIEAATGQEYGWLDNSSSCHADNYVEEPSRGYSSRSHFLRIDPDTISAALRLVRLTFLNRDEEIDQEVNGEPLAHAYEYLIRRKEQTVTPENVIEFSRLLKRQQGDMGDATQTGDNRSARTRSS